MRDAVRKGLQFSDHFTQSRGAFCHDFFQVLLALAQRHLCSLLLGDIAEDLRGARGCPARIPQRRNRKRNIDPAAILRETHCFVMLHSFARKQARQNTRFLLLAIGRNDSRNRLANHLFSPITQKPFRPRVPACDNPIQTLADDRILRRFHDCRQSCPHFVRRFQLGDVTREALRVNELAPFRISTGIDQHILD